MNIRNIIPRISQLRTYISCALDTREIMYKSEWRRKRGDSAQIVQTARKFVTLTLH